MDQDLFAHRTLTDLVEGLDHDGVLGEHLQVGDLKLVLVGLPSRHGLTHELDSFEEVGFVVTMAVEISMVKRDFLISSKTCLNEKLKDEKIPDFEKITLGQRLEKEVQKLTSTKERNTHGYKT